MRIIRSVPVLPLLLLLAACGQDPAPPPPDDGSEPAPAEPDQTTVRLRIRGLRLSLDPDAIHINVQLVNDSGDWVRYRSQTVQARLLLEEETPAGWRTIYDDPAPTGEPEETRSLAPGDQINCGNGSVKLPNAAIRLRATVPYLPHGAEKEEELVLIKQLHRFE